jgi:DNA-binding CsgD family transcriptional regulator
MTRHSTRFVEQVERSLAQLPALTPRERQVAVRVADGATDREIARDFGISARTVHKHLEQIYRKLDLTNRASLGAVIHRATQR